MKYSKFLSGCLLAALLLALTACGGQTPPDVPAEPEAHAQTPVETPETDPKETPEEIPGASEEPSESGGVLVVYYSATGSTRAVAETIADALGGDTFEIVPAEPYTSDDLNWRDTSSRVNQEHEDESKQDVKLTENTVDNWADYDAVFIGYPIWWGIAAWPVDNFIAANDFTGKTVIPFCTSSSSGLGESGENLQALSPDANWLEGMRFPSRAEENEIVAWVESLPISE